MRKQAGNPDLDGRPKLCVVIQFMPVCTEAPPISVGFAGGSNSPGHNGGGCLIARMWDAGLGTRLDAGRGGSVSVLWLAPADSV